MRRDFALLGLMFLCSAPVLAQKAVRFVIEQATTATGNFFVRRTDLGHGRNWLLCMVLDVRA
jgi:hypothetical protein